MINCANRSRSLVEHRSPISLLAFLPALFLLCMFAAFKFPEDLDLGYHLTIGSMVLDAFKMPQVDIFRIGSQAPEIAYSWLPDISLAFVERSAGVLGLRLWVIISILCLSLLMIGLVYDRFKAFYSSTFLFFASIALLPNCTVRPRVWAVILFVLLFYILRTTGDESSAQIKRRPILILLLAALWANIHISVFMLPVLIAAFGAGCLLQRSKPYSISYTLMLVVVSLAGMLCNPYGIELFSLLFAFSPVGSADVGMMIVEMRGLLELDPMPVWVKSGIVLSLLGVPTLVFAGILQLKSKAVGSGKRAYQASLFGALLIVAVCAVLGYQHSRHFSFFVLALLFALGCRERVHITVPRSASVLGVFVACLAVFVSLTQAVWKDSWYAAEGGTQKYPLAALSGVQSMLHEGAEEEGRLSVLAPFGLGHFTTWWLYSNGLSQKAGVVLDGRIDPEGQRRFFRVHDAYSGVCYQDVFADYNVDLVLVPEREDLFPLLLKDPNWAAVAGDDVVSFVRYRESMTASLEESK